MKNYPTPKTNAQEDYKNTFKIYNETITVDNVKRMGELIALNTLKFTAIHIGGYFEHMYRSLMRDIFNHKEKEHIISDGYDYAQEAIFFLCHFIGKNLKDTYCVDKHGRAITIWCACSKHVSRCITKDRKRVTNEEAVETIKFEPNYKTDKQIDDEQKKRRKNYPQNETEQRTEKNFVMLYGGYDLRRNSKTFIYRSFDRMAS